MAVPNDLAWLFWDMDPQQIDLQRDAHTVLTRVLEHGRLNDVHWLLRLYGRERVHQYFLSGPSPELSPRTLSFWRAFFIAAEETWPTEPDFRRGSGAPWPA
ncbi:MAG: hypothetical protein IPK82_29475 [Polyangiaceae bacterium]|nr:hypothetical protein [Polyangiaceae bacterium]